jgi:hypothetical protein
VSGARAVEHRAHAAALDLHRHRLILVGDERHFRHERKYTRHLAHDALRVDDRLSLHESGIGALVDEELLRKWIAAGVEHFSDGRCAAVARAQIEQRFEPRILGLGESEALHGSTLLDQPSLEFAVFLGERALRREIAADVSHSFAWQLRGALQRIEDDRHDLADVLQIAIARVEEEERKRDHAEEREPRERRRAVVEERRRLDGDVAHRDL